MPNYSREKAAWLAYLAGEPREAYRRLNANGTLTYEFVSDSGGRGSLSLRFPLAAFAHLCGFEYYKDEHKGRRAPQERFFHDLPSSGFNPARVDYTHRVGHPPVPFAKRRENTRRKIAVADIAFGRMEQASPCRRIREKHSGHLRRGVGLGFGRQEGDQWQGRGAGVLRARVAA